MQFRLLELDLFNPNAATHLILCSCVFQILSKLNHPNIATLYGYHLPLERMDNMCLIYELASEGSLEGFWKSDSGRQRLSNSTTRIRIAHQVATVVRYMHEGLDGQDKCYHRDIKSANVCLGADFTALVIDCGLSKYVEEGQASMSCTTSGKGTLGYICPEYNGGYTKFISACEVFSFGVFLCFMYYLFGPTRQYKLAKILNRNH